VHLLPPVPTRVRPGALIVLVLSLPWQALRAGTQVALLALDPRRTLRPGVVALRPRLPPGLGRDAFLAYASLLPGTLPAGEAAGGAVLVHALDTAAPVAADMAAAEARFARMLGHDA
jgi:multicomponent Na+:H+ antiporter subunit E